MARASVTLPASGTSGVWTGIALEIPAELMAGSSAGYMRRLTVGSPDVASFYGVVLRIAASASASGNVVGPDLSDAVERNSAAFTFAASDGDTVVLAGPNAAGAQVADASEPYFYYAPSGQLAALRTFFTDHGTESLTLTIDDGLQVIEDLEASASAGSPTASASLTTRPAVELSVLARAGTPAAGAALSRTRVLRSAASAGTPTASASLTLDNPEALAAAARAGAPSATATLSTVVRIAASASAGRPTASALLRLTAAPLVPGAPAGPLIAHAVEIATDPVTALWSGEGDLAIGGTTYRGRGELLSIGGASEESGRPDSSLRCAVSLVDDALRSRFLADIGNPVAIVRWLGRDDSGAWRVLPGLFRGRVSARTITSRTMSMEIVTLLGEPDRGIPLMWSHESQTARHPGDLGFEWLRSTHREQRRRRLAWPP